MRAYRLHPSPWSRNGIRREAFRVALAGALLAAGGCADQAAVTGPPRQPGELQQAAFLLTIDGRTGAVTVADPTPPRGRDGVVYSLLGADAVALHATNCTWGPSSSSKLRRCTIGLAVENRLSSVDLVTPTQFPRPPQGTEGILVFAFTAGALGISGGTATPSPDWNNPPMNFFNDFSGCGSGRTSDCYRSKTFPELTAGTTSEPLTVGFDVDRNAQSVAFSIVVAADLDENPVLETTLSGQECGFVTQTVEGPAEAYTTLGLVVGQHIEVIPGSQGDEDLLHRYGFCGFELPDGFDHAQIVSATLRLYQVAVFPLDAYEDIGSILVDHVDYGATLEGADLDPTVLTADFDTLSSDATQEYKELDVTAAVQADVDASRTRSQFRLQFANSPFLDVAVHFMNVGAAQPPQLVIVYKDH